MRASSLPAPRHRLVKRLDLIYYVLRVYDDGLVTVAPEGHDSFVILIEAKSVRVCSDKRGCRQVFPEKLPS